MADLSDAMNSLQNGITGISQDVKQFAGTPLGAVVIGSAVGGAVLGTTALGVASLKSKTGRRKRSARKKIMHTKRGRKQDRARCSKQKWEVAYRRKHPKKCKHKGKHNIKSKSKRGIHYTKNGQPYKILANGRARFVKR